MSWRDWTRKPPQLRVPQALPFDGWRQGAPDVYTCVDPPGYEKDPAITAAIHEFDPGVIPICRIQTWLPPRSMAPMRVVHHGIGRFYPYPRHLRRHFHVEMPQLAQYPVPNFLDAIFSDPGATNYIGPAGYLPWDWDRYLWCREKFEYITAEKYEERVARRQAEIDKARQKFAEEQEYKMKQFGAWSDKKLEEVTEADWREYQQLVAQGGRQGGRRRAVRTFRGGSLPAAIQGIRPGETLVVPTGRPRGM